MSEFIILAIPFIGTSLGSAMVFFLKKRIAPKFEKMLLGFAAGVDRKSTRQNSSHGVQSRMPSSA